MPDLVLVLTDRHNLESVVAALPHGSVYVGIALTGPEWEQMPSAAVAQQILEPMYVTAKQRWPERLVPVRPS